MEKIMFVKSLNGKSRLIMKKKISLLFFGFMVIIACYNTSQAMFAMPQRIPVDRLICNASAYIEENPEDANGYYVLGRIHYLAFSNKTVVLPASDKGENNLPKIPENIKLNYANMDKVDLCNRAYWLTLHSLGIFLPRDEIPELSKEAMEEFVESYKNKVKELQDHNYYRQILIINPDPNELIQHATEAIKNFQKAIEIDPNNGLHHLGLASLLEQYVNYLKEINVKEVPEEISNIILNRARDIYLRAYELSIIDDLKPDRKFPLEGFRAGVSYEAGYAYIRLVGMQKSISALQKATMAEVNQQLTKGLRKHIGGITPIVFSLKENTSPAELIGRNLKVNFDLDGNGQDELWPWVKPSTGILVWNEDGTGRISSGRQLLGSVTWWLFFKDGYHALDCLDDNRDRILSGNELTGISVWFDTNSNGKSEQEEIKSLEELGITSISTESTSTENGWLANKTGIKLKNTQTIPTYDWIAVPIKENQGQP